MHSWAEALGYTQHTSIGRMERGEFMPRLDVLWRIVHATRCSWDYLFEGVLSPEMPQQLLDQLRSIANSGLKERADFYLERDRFHEATKALNLFADDPPERKKSRHRKVRTR